MTSREHAAPPTGSEELSENGSDRGPKPMRSSFLFRATMVATLLAVVGAVLGLVRDLSLARYFGASANTDAVLVAWTIPDLASLVLVEDAMAFLLVPAFSRALLNGRDAAKHLMAATLPRLSAILVLVSAATMLSAPILVNLLAPGLAAPDLAVQCMRLTALSIFMLGITGYLSAALRSHHFFGAPAAVNAAFNIGIIGMIVLLHDRIDVLSAAVGIVLGSLLMVFVQLPTFFRNIGNPFRARSSVTTAITFAAFVPIAAYTVARHAQVFVERFFGSSLSPGTISHLNYAQKVAQVPMVLALVITLVTFPMLAQAIAARRPDEVRRLVERDLRVVSAIVLVATAYLVAFAPAIVRVLFQHGEFTVSDTADTAGILRVYALGLLGQAVVGVLLRCFFSWRSTWFPAAVMGVGLIVTAVVAGLAAPYWDAGGIAAANGLGITLSAALMLVGIRKRVVNLQVTSVVLVIARLIVPAAVACVTGLGFATVLGGLPALAEVVIGGLTVLFAFVVLAAVIDPHGTRQLVSLVARRPDHAR